ncbi:MAG: galactosyltransferase-related protein [Verrucomicrobia bacterium]|nr:galactosyltransferase-related protein [Verrucomicrobiota bacterium]
MSKGFTLKQHVGALLFDLPLYISKLLYNYNNNIPHSWIGIRNRKEQLMSSVNGKGVRCNWQWTSDLYLPKIFPMFGRWLFRRATRDFPVFSKERTKLLSAEKPDVSFIIGHRGSERLPILLAMLKSIGGQTGCHIECIVVEQDNNEIIKEHLPDWVRYIYTPLPVKEMCYSRSWAFNVGSKVARSPFLIFHDNDMLVPAIYAKDLFHYYQRGFDFINIKRFIFYLSNGCSKAFAETGDFSKKPEFDAIVQNLEAGGSFGAGRQAYFDIGGFDERFIGWGGEDNEFWERAQTKKVYPYGYLPLIHLWHEAQREKRLGASASTMRLYEELTRQDPFNRIQYLRNNQLYSSARED